MYIIDIRDWIHEVTNTSELTLYSTVRRMLLSFVLGSIVGFERQLRNHAAGFRTFALICSASTLIMIVSIYVTQTYSSTSDPARIAAQVVTGIGFLGAGAIYQNKGGIRGLTTIAGIFMIAAIGLAVGAGLFKAAVIGTCLLLFILISLERIEGRMQIDTNGKHLLIEYDHINMDIDTLKTILKSYKIHIHSISVSEDFKTHSGSIDFVIAVPASVKLPVLFEQLRKTTGTWSIHLESI